MRHLWQTLAVTALCCCVGLSDSRSGAADAFPSCFTMAPTEGQTIEASTGQGIESPFQPMFATGSAAVQPGGGIPARPEPWPSLTYFEPTQWGSYAATEVRMGDNRSLADAIGFFSLWEDDTQLLFADVRGQFDDTHSREGNWGIGLRSIVNDDLIVGGYSFYDYRWSNTGKTFDQVTVGLELKSYAWDFRANGYIALDGTKLVSSTVAPGVTPTAVFENNTIRVISGGGMLFQEFERAYSGFDAEIGALLTAWGTNNSVELRSYVGGYYFDGGGNGFPNVAGPRTRLELTAFDIPYMGMGSRVMLGVEYTWDQVRDDRVSALVGMQVPLNFWQPRARLSPFSRRMLDRVRRDVDIVTNTYTKHEQTPLINEAAVYADTNTPVGTVTLVDADTSNLPAVIDTAGPNSTVIVDGSQGTLYTAHTLSLHDGQTLRGAGFQVRGVQTGQLATFGERPTIESSDPFSPVIELANYNTVMDLNLVGGIYGIATSACGCDDLIGGTITGNHVSGEIAAGYLFGNIDADSVVANNVVEGGLVGFNMGDIKGTVSGNQAINSLTFGYASSGIGESGVVDSNLAQGGLFGFYVDSVKGTFSNNEATGNEYGHDISRVEASGSVIGNLASYNNEAGIQFDEVYGTVSGNTATYNGDGIVVHELYGTLSDNLSSNNTGGGFFVFELFDTGVFTDNRAIDNSDRGYWVPIDWGGTSSNNTGSGNGSHNTYP